METKVLKRLPVGIQTYSEIVNLNCVYIDKTEYIHRMVHSANRYFFLSRPTHFEARPSTISRMMSLRRWRIFPLTNLRKSGTDEANSISLFSMLLCGSILFCIFAV